ncbi:phage tail protein [Bacillus sp. JJ1773]|uniref:phage tail-collar fiber domain-containing protein n=1 Tax=Bacillus sp. JJ1773 TaxID=3122965 RepID=UPI002FFFC233
MSAFGGLILTNRGRNLQAKAQAGATLQYTRIALGDGFLGTSAIADLTALKNQVKSLPITKLRVMTGSRAILGTVLTNKDLVSGFYYRELGIFAQDPDLGEILYCYGNARDLAEYIPADGGADVLEKNIDLEILTGNAANVSAVIDSSLVYITMPELDATKTELKKYTDDAVGAIDLSGLATKQDLNTHLADEEQHLKVGERDKWNKGISSDTILAIEDWNNYKSTGFFMGQSLLHSPDFKTGDSPWWYVQVIQHNADYCVQIAWNLNNSKRAMSRSLVNGIWTKWENAGGGGSVETLELVAGENIVAGDGVQLNPNGELIKIKYSHPTVEFGDSFAHIGLPASVTNRTYVQVLMVDNRPTDTVITYRDTVLNTMHIQYHSVDINGNATAFEVLNTHRSAVTASTNFPYSACITEDDRLVVLVNIDGTTTASSTRIYVMQINRANNTLTLLDDSTIPVSFYGTNARLAYLGNNKFFFYRSQSSSSQAAHGAVITLNANGTLSVATGKSLHAGSKSYDGNILVIDSTWVLFTTDGANVLILAEISGTTIGTVKTFQASARFDNLYLLPNGRILATSSYNNGIVAMYELTESRDLVLLDSIVLSDVANRLSFKASSSTLNCKAVIFDESTFGVCYPAADPYTTATVMVNIHFDHETNKFDRSAFNNKTTLLTQFASTNGRAMIVNDTMSDAVIARVYGDRIANGENNNVYIGKLFDSATIAGIAVNNASKGQKCKVAIRGFVDVYSDLETGKYYALKNNKLVKVSNINKALGIATTTNELLLLKGVI